MSSITQFIEDWNSIFEFKIKESDLQKPSENFLFNVLTDYLKMLNMDISPQMKLYKHASSDAARPFKIKFCEYINHIYKISCADNNFYYYDLIKPSPKKTKHMLKFLLNYFHFFERFHKETIGVTLTKKKTADRLINKKTKDQLEIEPMKMKLEEMEEKIKENNAMLPNLVDEIETLASQEKDLINKIAQLRDAVTNNEAILSQLKTKEEELKSQLVSDEETENLLGNKAMLEKAISEQKEVKKATQAKIEESKTIIDKMEPANDKLELTMKSFPVDDLNSLRKIKSELQQISQKCASQQAINDKKKKLIETKLELANKNEKILVQKKEIFANAKEKADGERTQMEKNLENHSKLTGYLESELEAVETELKIQNNHGDFLVENIELIVEKICVINNCHNI